MDPSLTAEIETLKKIYAAINANEMAVLEGYFDPEIEWIEFAGLPQGGEYRGLAVVMAHFARSRDTWAEGTCQPERFIVAGDKIVVFDYVQVRLKDSVEWLEGPLAAVYKFRDGKAFQVRIFQERQEALDWAGVTSEDLEN